MEKYMTKDEVAAALGVSTKRVQRWTTAGVLRASRLGTRTVRYRESDIEALFERFRDDPEDDGASAATRRRKKRIDA
jgi:excisionase family DNA binding protein